MYGKYMVEDIMHMRKWLCTRPLLGGEGPGNEARPSSTQQVACLCIIWPLLGFN